MFSETSSSKAGKEMEERSAHHSSEPVAACV